MNFGAILEENLERLFARAYAPVLPSEEFRARLLREIERSSTARRRRFVDWRAAAALLLAIGAGLLGWRTLRSPARVESVERLLASGRPAVREGAAAGWRPLTEDERRSGVRLGKVALELATPSGAPAAVLLGSSGKLDAQGASRLSIDASGEVALEYGAVALERLAAGSPWRVSTHDGAILLDRGTIELACLERGGAPATRALLRAGSAAVDADPRADLVPGREVWLRGGALLDGGQLDGIASGHPPRTGAGTEAPAEPDGTSDPAAKTASLRGKVSVPSDAKMPETYVVTLLRRERLPEVSRPDPQSFRDAEFSLEGLKPGTYAVFVQAAGWSVWQRDDVELAAGAPAVVLDIVLDAGASVSGRVLDHLGRPVEGALVLSERDTPSQLLPFDLESPPEGWTAIAASHADGAFELVHLSRGAHRFRATRAGHGACWSEVVDLSPGDKQEVTLRLVEPGAIEGHVAHDDGSPWPGATVIASWIDTRALFPERAFLSFGYALTDGQGRYAIEDLPPGVYVVLNVSEARESGAPRIPRVQQARVQSGERTRLDLPGGVLGTSIEGTLLSVDDEPLAGLDVTLVPKHEEGGDWKSTRSREGGRFDFPSLPPGTYVVYVGANLGIDLALQSEIEVPEAPVFRPTLRAGKGVLRGRVLDARSGTGLENAVVILEVETAEGAMFAGRTIADAQGRYAVSRLPGAKYRATAYSATSRLGQESVDGIAVGGSAGDAVQDFELRPGAELEIRVQAADGRPLSNAGLRFLDETGIAVGFSPDDRTDAKGFLRIRGVKPGRWTLRTAHEQFEPATTTLDLAAGEVRAVEVTLQPSH